MTDENRIALVTGATRGIGRAIAERLATAGYRVIGTATTEEGALAISNYLQERGRGYRLDVADPASIDALMQSLQTEEHCFPAVLVNNAAITRDNLALRMKNEEWETVIQTNLNSVFYMIKACLKGMCKARYGRIINVTSVVGVTGNPGQINYSAAKAGIIGLTKSLAQEMASRNITVNAVAPGFIDTDMTRQLSDEQRERILVNVPLARLGAASDVANAVHFLASPEASYITGQTLHVNGGLYMS
jgi:3-oxoacyl-[acyl-carrier protein] reductase